jgi:putative SOS response-associated peptidase YedK
MCGRKTLTRDMQSIIQELAIDEWHDDDFHPSFNIAPTQTSPILIGDGNSRIVRSMKWGLIPSWSKDESIGSKMINARSETIQEKPSFQNLINQNRCVVITDGYYEWNRRQDRSQPFYIFHPEKKLLPMAGLWTTWETTENEIIHSYTVITTSPQKEIRHIHNRMPAILNPMAIDEWIHCEKTPSNQAMTNLVSMVKPLAFHPVSSFVNSPKNNTIDCIRSTQDSSTINLFD